MAAIWTAKPPHSSVLYMYVDDSASLPSVFYCRDGGSFGEVLPFSDAAEAISIGLW